MTRGTDIVSVRSIALAMLYLPVQSDTILPDLLLSHPFTNCRIVAAKTKDGKQKTVDILADDESLALWQETVAEVIRESDLWGIYVMLDKRYNIAFFQKIAEYLSKEDYSRLWADIWTTSEGVNRFEVISQEETIKIFQQCDPKILMGEDDYKAFCQLPEEITVYRGVCPRKGELAPEEQMVGGLSWTKSRERARWFATRFLTDLDDQRGIVYEATIQKPYVLACFNSAKGAEREIVVQPEHLKNIRQIH